MTAQGVKHKFPKMLPRRVHKLDFHFDAVTGEMILIPPELKIISQAFAVTFCYVIELSQDCTTPLIKLDRNDSLSGQLHCDVTSLNSEETQSDYKILNRTGDEFLLKVVTDSDIGRFKFACIETDDVFTPNASQFEIVGVDPSEVLVDTEVKLMLTVLKQPARNGTWCFVNTPDNNIEILLASWVSDTQVDCTGFNPKVANAYRISLSSTITPDMFDNGVTVQVTSQHPVAQKAEYSSDFENILIHFDKNIELHSPCGDVFSKDIQERFGGGFNCFASGNLLVVKMGLQFQFIDTIAIGPDNKICQAGSQESDCLSAPPSSLDVFKPKIPDPKLSLCLKSPCSGSETQKYAINVTPYKGPKNSVAPNQTPQMKTAGKTQRKNLMIWRRMRQFQRKIPRQVDLQMNSTDILPLLEDARVFDSGSVNENLGSSARVSLTVKSSLTTSTVVAQADVTFCEDSVKLFRYKWLVNGKEVSDEGKLLILKDLTPGKYLIKCLAVAVNSTEILGQGWSTAEVVHSERKVFIVPLELTTGTADDITLRADGSYASAWSCRTIQGEPCATAAGELVSNVVDLNSASVTIPAGTLPVGGYTWTVENASNAAKVFVKSGNIPAVGVEMTSAFVKPEEFALTGTVRRATGDCRAWWSSVREFGFNYLHLNKTAEYPVKETIPLVIPSNMWKDAPPNSKFIFKFQVFCSQNSENQQGSYDYIKVPVVISNLPSVSPLTVEPTTGKAMITDFAVSGGEMDTSNDDRPLTFEWSYVDYCGAVVPVGRGASARNFKTYLPPGDVKLIVKVCEGENICSTISTPTISVIQASEFPVENFRNARNHIEQLMTSGDTMEAFGLAITVFKSLALVAETQVREEVFSTVREGIKTKIGDLTRKLRSDPRALMLCLEFFERAQQVARYFRKGSDIGSLLAEFKKNLNSVRH